MLFGMLAMMARLVVATQQFDETCSSLSLVHFHVDLLSKTKPTPRSEKHHRTHLAAELHAKQTPYGDDDSNDMTDLANELDTEQTPHGDDVANDMTDLADELDTEQTRYGDDDSNTMTDVADELDTEQTPYGDDDSNNMTDFADEVDTEQTAYGDDDFGLAVAKAGKGKNGREKKKGDVGGNGPSGGGSGCCQYNAGWTNGQFGNCKWVPGKTAPNKNNKKLRYSAIGPPFSMKNFQDCNAERTGRYNMNSVASAGACAAQCVTWDNPSPNPRPRPTPRPTFARTPLPTRRPTRLPTPGPTRRPTLAPTNQDETRRPTPNPTTPPPTPVQTCVNTRDNTPNTNTCASQITNGNKCTDYLNWGDCDDACNLCPCSTAFGTTRGHCNDNGDCSATCFDDTCADAECVCYEGWTGALCDTKKETTTADHRCTIVEDPHINSFDGNKVSLREVPTLISFVKANRSAAQMGIKWLVRSNDVSIQAQYLPDVNLSAKNVYVYALAVGGSFLGGNTLFLRPLRDQLTWGDVEILNQTCQHTLSAGSSCVFTNGYITAQYFVDSPWHTRAKAEPGVVVDLPLGLNIVANFVGNHINILINMPPLDGGQDGLCGNFNGDVDDDTLTEDANRNAVEVTEADSLFPVTP